MLALFAFIRSVFLLLFFLVVANSHTAGTSQGKDDAARFQ